MSTRIRLASSTDDAGIADVHIRSFLATYPDLPATRRAAERGAEVRREHWRRLLERPDARRATLVAEEGEGRLLGFVHFGHSPDTDATGRTGHIFSIHVSPDRTGERIGARLMDQALALLVESGHTVATLWAVADNEEARRFYEREGWRADGSERREVLAVGDEDGDEVTVVRYRIPLDAATGDPQ